MIKWASSRYFEIKLKRNTQIYNKYNQNLKFCNPQRKILIQPLFNHFPKRLNNFTSQPINESKEFVESKINSSRIQRSVRPDTSKSKSLVGSRDEILTQLNAADKAVPDIGTPLPCNSITLTREGRGGVSSRRPFLIPLLGHPIFAAGWQRLDFEVGTKQSKWHGIMQYRSVPVEILDITFR